jgi:hypothetical protein
VLCRLFVGEPRLHEPDQLGIQGCLRVTQHVPPTDQ